MPITLRIPGQREAAPRTAVRGAPTAAATKPVTNLLDDVEVVHAFSLSPAARARGPAEPTEVEVADDAIVEIEVDGFHMWTSAKKYEETVRAVRPEATPGERGCRRCVAGADRRDPRRRRPERQRGARAQPAVAAGRTTEGPRDPQGVRRGLRAQARRSRRIVDARQGADLADRAPTEAARGALSLGPGRAPRETGCARSRAGHVRGRRSRATDPPFPARDRLEHARQLRRVPRTGRRGPVEGDHRLLRRPHLRARAQDAEPEPHRERAGGGRAHARQRQPAPGVALARRVDRGPPVAARDRHPADRGLHATGRVRRRRQVRSRPPDSPVGAAGEEEVQRAAVRARGLPGARHAPRLREHRPVPVGHHLSRRADPVPEGLTALRDRQARHARDGQAALGTRDAAGHRGDDSHLAARSPPQRGQRRNADGARRHRRGYPGWQLAEALRHVHLGSRDLRQSRQRSRREHRLDVPRPGAPGSPLRLRPGRRRFSLQLLQERAHAHTRLPVAHRRRTSTRSATSASSRRRWSSPSR